MARGGQFTISDDSHSIEHIGSNYRDLVHFANMVGISRLTYLERGAESKDARFPSTSAVIVSLSIVQGLPFFETSK